MKWKISLEEVNELLACPELHRVQAPVAAALNLPIVVGLDAMSIWGELSVSWLSKADFLSLLTERADLIIALGRGIQTLEGSDDEEFAPGEEELCRDPSEALKKEIVGLGNGFGLTVAIYLNFLLADDIGGLTAFLKARRMPDANKFTKQLRTLFMTIRHKQ